MSTSTAAQILEAQALGAGLSSQIEAFPTPEPGQPFAERLASHPLLMAPMAGVTDASYRLMARAGGAHLAYSEMVSCAGLHYGERSWSLAALDPAEPDLAVQLFGSKPELFEEAAAGLVERLGDKLALIDINMACPVPKVTKRGEGSALLEHPDLAARLVEACRRGAPSVPVTVKIRRGRYDGKECAPEFARAMEAAGAAAVAVHGRYASQLYRGASDWTCIERVADAVSIPVIGSGDVSTPEAAVRMLRETGATAVMIARGSYGSPWIFSQAQDLLEGEEIALPSIAQRLNALACQIALLEACGADLRRGRTIAGWYVKGLPEAARWRGLATKLSTAEEFMDYIAQIQALVEVECDEQGLLGRNA